MSHNTKPIFYLWNILDLEESTGRKKNLYIYDNCCSPYEVRMSKVKSFDYGIDITKRFRNLFKAYLHYKATHLKEENSQEELPYFELENKILHILGEIDLMSGINISYVIRKNILKEILTEDEALLFTQEEKNKIVINYYKMKKIHNNIPVFFEIIKELFTNAYAYIHKPTKQIFIYTSDKKNEKNMKKMDTVIKIFLDIFFDVDIFWEYHFGIIGVDNTMKIGKIQL